MKSTATLFLTLSACAALVQAGTVYRNPVLAEKAADPSVIRKGSTYYMYPSGYHVYTSTTNMTSWVKGPRVFDNADCAPDVYLHTDGVYYLYYAKCGVPPRGVAHASSPMGPFISDRTGLVCGDLHLFRDDDSKLYLFGSGWAGVGSHSGLCGMKMDNPTTPNAAGWSRGLVFPDSNRVDQVWEWEVTGYKKCEGPWMVKHKGVYYLMYSGSGWNGPEYAVGYATATDPMGPYTKFWGNPIIRRSDFDSIWGPGHHSVVKDENGVDWVAYHQRPSAEYGGSGGRHTAIDPMWFDSSGVIHCRATRGVDRPAPGTNPWPSRDAHSAIEMESNNGWHPRLTLKASSVTSVSGTCDSAYITFRNVDFGAGANRVVLRRASESPVGAVVGTFKVRLGGVFSTSVADCNAMGTDGAWRSDDFVLNRTVAGVHDVVLTFHPDAKESTMGTLDWMQFTVEPGGG